MSQNVAVDYWVKKFEIKKNEALKNYEWRKKTTNHIKSKKDILKIIWAIFNQYILVTKKSELLNFETLNDFKTTNK